MISVCVQLVRQSHPLGSAVSLASRDHREISQHDGRSRPPADGQGESGRQIHGFLLPFLKSETGRIVIRSLHLHMSENADEGPEFGLNGSPFPPHRASVNHNYDKKSKL